MTGKQTCKPRFTIARFPPMPRRFSFFTRPIKKPGL
jgi:hypothetical protein